MQKVISSPLLLQSRTDAFSAGVSLITQILYALVFVTRYLDMFKGKIQDPRNPEGTLWNFILKNFYIITSFYIIFVMMRVFARTREREKAWKLGAYCLAISALLAPPATIVSNVGHENAKTTILGVLWTFSIILESVCVVPQLLLLRQTTVPTVIDSYYLLTLGSYRAFYILSWIYRGFSKEHHFEWRSVVFGIIQTALYIDFAWVYWTRQRVKLRNGGVVDSDDLSRGYLVGRVLGRGDPEGDAEERVGLDGANEPNGAAATRKGGSWGARGISVSADEDVVDSPYSKADGTATRNAEVTNDGLTDFADDENDVGRVHAESDIESRRPSAGQVWRD